MRGWRDRLPGADRLAVVGIPGLRLIHVAKLARLHQRAQLLRLGAGALLVADLKLAPGALLRSDHRLALGGRDPDRFLAIDVMPRIHRIDRKFRVPVVRRRDRHYIDRLGVEQSAIVTHGLWRGMTLGGKLGGAFGENLRIYVDKMRYFDVGQLRKGAHMRHSAAVYADDGDPQAVVRPLDLRIAPRTHRDAQRGACPRQNRTPVQHGLIPHQSSRSLIDRKST